MIKVSNKPVAMETKMTPVDLVLYIRVSTLYARVSYQYTQWHAERNSYMNSTLLPLPGHLLNRKGSLGIK